MNARNGPFTITAILIGATMTAGPTAWTASAFGQAGVRQRVNRQLGQRAGEQPQPGPHAQHGQPGQPGEAAADDDLKKIHDAKTVEDLVDLGKTFVLTQKLEAAAQAVEEIVARKPELLEDAQKQTPKSWNDFWFAHRAKMREKKLRPNDAAGRAKIAVWLQDAGLGGPARAMLATAMAINKNDPAVKQLAEKWSVYSGGPVRFDLTLGLKEPLIIPTIQDEGQTVSPRGKEHMFLILPIAYHAAGLRLLINKSDIKATGDDGKVCPVTGLMLLESGPGNPAGAAPAGADPLPDRGRVPEMKLPIGNEPLWEAMQVQAAAAQPGRADAAGQPPQQEIVLKNIMHPIVRPAPGQPRGAAAPAPAGNRPTQETKPSTGYAAYVLEIPQASKTVECSYNKGESQLTLDIEFLRVLSKATDKLQPIERDSMVRTLAGQATAKSAPVASAALRKLNAIRLVAGKGQESGEAKLKASPTVTAIEKVLLAALAHENPLVRRDAFDLLNRESSLELVDLVAGTADASVLGNLAAEAQAYFTELREAMAAAEAAKEASAGTTPQPAPPGEQQTTAVLPPLPAAQGVVLMLTGCLRCKQAPIHEQALDIVLTNPFDQTIGILSDVSDESVSQLLARVPRIEDAKVKQAILGILMKRGSDRQLREILTAFSNAPVIISSDNDPILQAALREQQSGEVQRLILELLARADLSAVEGSEKIKKLIESLTAADVKRDPAVHKAMVNLARKQLKAGYQAPIKRANRNSQDKVPVGFDTLLAAVAVAPNTDAQTARQAATGLLMLGQVDALRDRLTAMQSGGDTRAQDFIQNLARDKSLWNSEALPIFLAGQLAGANQQLAVTALSAIQKSVDPKQRWRVNLAIKQGLEPKQLVTLSVNSNEKISRPALALLRDLAGMTAAEAAEFEGVADENGRQDKLNTLEQSRSSKAVGAFACMVYVDVRASSSPTTAQPGKPRGSLERNSVPLTSAAVTFKRAAQGGQVGVIAEGMQIGPPDSRQGGAAAAPGSIQISPGLLLLKALDSAEAQREGLAGKVNRTALRSAQPCELKYEGLGAWGAEVTIPDATDAASAEFPFKIVSAKILLEPVTQ